MLITREIDYALRVLRALEDGEKRSIQEICQKEATPRQFIYRIVKKLENMGWICIFHGVKGGCCLITDLETVNLYELIEGMKVEKVVSECLIPGYQCTRSEVCNDVCNIHIGFESIQKKIDEELKSYTIHMLIRGREKV
ncbi:MAG: RrF2 family transcriptional regulator [Lachnospiraceae bacterium]